jgi:hypothetical protein
VFAALFPVGLKALDQYTIARPRCRCLVQNDKVQSRHLGLLLSERFPDDSLDPVPARSQPAILLADREPQSWLIGAVRPVENSKHFVAAAVGFFKYATERGFVGKPASTSEAAVHVGTISWVIFRGDDGQKPARLKA